MFNFLGKRKVYKEKFFIKFVLVSCKVFLNSDNFSPTKTLVHTLDFCQMSINIESDYQWSENISILIFFKIVLPVSQFSFRNHSRPKNANSHYAEVPTQWAKTKGLLLDSIKPRPRAAQKPRISFPNYSGTAHCNCFLLETYTDKFWFTGGKKRYRKRHAIRNFCVTSRRSHVLG